MRACDRSAEAWEAGARIDGKWDGEILHGDVADFGSVDRALDGMDALVHAAVYFSGAPGAYGVDDELPFLVNLKGLWNVLEAARIRRIRRVVHIGLLPGGAPGRGLLPAPKCARPDAGLYSVTKRLQEEMCRQYHDAFGMSIVVLRPCSIVDLRKGIDKQGARLQPGSWNLSWVCRHDLAQACRLALEKEGSASRCSTSQDLGRRNGTATWEGPARSSGLSSLGMPTSTGDRAQPGTGFRRSLLLAGTALALPLPEPAAAAAAGAGGTADFAGILATEEAILSLTPRLKRLGRTC